jgi:alanyl-tRNA synthetase
MGQAKESGKGIDQTTYSLELCGGTHVAQTGDIGGFVILSDSASSAGVRRVEALTGAAASAHLAQQSAVVSGLASALKAPMPDLEGRVAALLEERKTLANEVAQLRRELALAGGAGQADAPQAKEVNGVAFLGQVVSGVSGKDLPALIDSHKASIGSVAVLLIADLGGKVAVCAGVSSDLLDRISAVDMVKAAVPFLGGKGGGGRPDMAQGGGSDISNAAQAVEAVEALLQA